MNNKNSTFTIELSTEYFCAENVLNPPDVCVEVVSGPTHHYGKWYHKILYYLSFKTKFIESWSYTVEPCQDD